MSLSLDRLFNRALARFSFSALFLISPFLIEAHGFKPVTTPLPVDVSFLIVDTKYNEERGAQICEIQHGGLSGFTGNVNLHERKDRIVEKLVDGLSSLFERSWVAPQAFVDPTIKRLLSEHNQWTHVNQLLDFNINSDFLSKATRSPKKSNDLSTYHGLVCISPAMRMDRDEFRANYPGVILIDNAFYSYAISKAKITELLLAHPLTKEHKPKCGLYNKHDNNLSERIDREIGSDLYVLKPIDEFNGKGVIIFRKEDLNMTLDYLFKRKSNGLYINDKAYDYWRNGNEAEFIVEEFIEVEPVSVPHLEGNLYCPTLRLAFLLIYSKNTIDIVGLGGYYTLPRKALNEPGSLNERYKSYVVPPHFAKADLEIQEKAEIHIKEVLKIVYKKLLGIE